MTNIIQFPEIKDPKKFINNDVQSALNKLDKVTRENIEEIIQATAEKYSFVCDALDIELPESTTQEQRDVIQALIIKQRSAIVELVNDLITQKAMYELRK